MHEPPCKTGGQGFPGCVLATLGKWAETRPCHMLQCSSGFLRGREYTSAAVSAAYCAALVSYLEMAKSQKKRVFGWTLSENSSWKVCKAFLRKSSILVRCSTINSGLSMQKILKIYNIRARKRNDRSNFNTRLRDSAQESWDMAAIPCFTKSGERRDQSKSIGSLKYSSLIQVAHLSF